MNKVRFDIEFEASMWRSLFRLVSRKGPFDVPPGGAAFLLKP